MISEIEREAKRGNRYAMLSLAYSYHHGIDRDYDPDKAMEWYKKSAVSGCAMAMWELSRLYYKEELVSENYFEYVHWLSCAAQAGIPEAMNELARMYYHGIMLPKDEAMSVELMKRAAEVGDKIAQFYMSYFYRNGILVKKSPSTADQYEANFMRHVTPEGMFKIGKAFEYGHKPLEKDMQEAVRWYKLAAEQGSEKSIYCLERIKAEKASGKVETEEQRDARISCLPCMIVDMEHKRLIEEADRCIEVGDYETALSKYNQSAELGNAEALYMLALIFLDGEIVEKDERLAMDYLFRAANNGCTDAQLTYGRMCEEGEGREKDLEEAKKYYALAVAYGNLLGYFELSRISDWPDDYVFEMRRKVR